MNLLAYFLGVIVFMAAGVVCHELGHLIGGLLSGYRFLSFRLLSLLWQEENGKIVLKKSDALKGIAAGQCLLRPADDFKDFRYILYNLGGGMANLLLAAGLFAICVFTVDMEVLYEFCFGGVIMNVLLAILNLVPMVSGGVPNDGKNVRLAAKSEVAKRAFWSMLVYNYEIVEGKRPRELNENDYAIPADADLSNYLLSYCLVIQAERLSDLGFPDEAHEIYQRIPCQKLPSYYGNAVLCELLYYYSAVKKDENKAKDIYTRNKLKKYLDSIKQPSIMGAHAAYKFFIENDRGAGWKMLRDAKEVNETFPYKGQALAEADRLARLEEGFRAREEPQ